MWGCVAVDLEAMSVEGPGFSWVLVKPAGIGHLWEADSGVAKGGVGFPETFVATEGGEAGVGSHAGTGTDEECICVLDGVGSGFEVGDHESELLGTLSPSSARHTKKTTRRAGAQRSQGADLFLFQKLDGIGDDVAVRAFVG